MKQINIFAENCDANTLEQFENCTKNDFVVAAALMPDAHSGYVAPIGSVIATKKMIVPAWVGYDIGCGVTAVRLEGNKILENITKNKNEIYEEVLKTIPMGLGKKHSESEVSKETILKFRELLDKFKKSPHDESILDFLKRKSPSNLGTLGHGNHFIEISQNEEEAWIIIHSGSRNIGHKVAQKYMKKFAHKEKNFEDTYPLQDDSDLGKEYLAVLDFGLEFALLNRIEIAKNVVECIETILKKSINYEIWANKNHNHAIKSEFEGENVYIHRKGATPATKGEKGVIPGNMRDGTYLVEGLGNKEFLESSSHGAGRKMSRKKAKESISMKDFTKSMEGILGTVKQSTLDEAPEAYKKITDVMDLQKESVKIIKHLKPLINWKG
ncbi:MAG: RtcB family protein [Nanobdellota archaeon]